MNITTTTTFAAAAIAAWLLTFLPSSACASDDHAHATPTPSAIAGTAAPTRFALVSDTLELVGLLQGRQLTLYLDRAADNSPVSGARIALHIGGQRITATPQGAGADTYAAALPATLKPGHLPVSAVITLGDAVGDTGDDADSVLSGELDLPDTAAAATHEGNAHGPMWSRAAAWSAAALGLALAAVWALSLRARLARRRLAIGSTAHTGSAA